MELYAVKQLVEVISEGPHIVYVPINNSSVKNSNKTDVPLGWEEEMHDMFRKFEWQNWTNVLEMWLILDQTKKE